MTQRSYLNQSVTRAFDVLRCFDQTRRPLTVSAIAELTGFPLPTAFRFVRTLESEGILERLDSGAYRPSLALLRLGFATLDSMDLVRFADPRLRALAERTMETVNLGVLDRGDVRYLVRVRNADLVTADLRVGSLLPAPSTSLGKLLLASLPERDLDAREASLDFQRARGERALRTGMALRAELERIRERGWSFQDEELEHGLRSIAAPVFDHTGRVIAAVNLAVPASRWSMDDLTERFLAPLLQCGAQISRDLGYHGTAEHERWLRHRNAGSEPSIVGADMATSKTTRGADA